MIEYKSGEELGFMKKSPHSPECVSSIYQKEKLEVQKGAKLLSQIIKIIVLI